MCKIVKCDNYCGMEGEYNIMTLFDLCSRPCFVEEESVAVVLGLNKCYIP